MIKKRGKWRKGRIVLCLLGILAVGCLFTTAARDVLLIIESFHLQIQQSKAQALDKNIYPQELIDLLEKNEETYDFVIHYPENKEKDFKIDLSTEAKQERIPLFLQWDERWGYKEYGSNMLALTGCGPTCLSMVYIGLTGDDSMNPKEMAKFSEKSGYYTENGTSWSFMTEGAEILGLTAEELPLDESCIKQHLSKKEPIICSMGAGDFTTQGHFIVLAGVDKNGNILVNDPNSKKNSEQSWEYTSKKSMGIYSLKIKV